MRFHSVVSCHGAGPAPAWSLGGPCTNKSIIITMLVLVIVVFAASRVDVCVLTKGVARERWSLETHSRRHTHPANTRRWSDHVLHKRNRHVTVLRLVVCTANCCIKMQIALSVDDDGQSPSLSLIVAARHRLSAAQSNRARQQTEKKKSRLLLHLIIVVPSPLPLCVL